jgi:hypothetical protein
VGVRERKGGGRRRRRERERKTHEGVSKRQNANDVAARKKKYSTRVE